MYSADLEDERIDGNTIADDLVGGTCFMYNGMLCMAMDRYQSVFAGYARTYGVILANVPSNEYVGDLVELDPDDVVEVVDVRAKFTIVE